MWAAIRGEVCYQNCHNFHYFDLGKLYNDLIEFEIIVEENILRIVKDGEDKIGLYDASYWADIKSYFKAGAYNQVSGTSMTQYENINFYHEKK